MYAFNPLRLHDMVAGSASVQEDDTLATKQALNRLGYFKTPKEGMDPWPDTQMFDAIEKFQKDKGLTPDRWMNPGGETETAINKELRKRRTLAGKAGGQQATLLGGRPAPGNNPDRPTPVPVSLPREPNQETLDEIARLKRELAKIRRKLQVLYDQLAKETDPDKRAKIKNEVEDLVRMANKIMKDIECLER